MDMKIALTKSKNNNLIRAASSVSSHENPSQDNEMANQFSLNAPDSETISKTPKTQANLSFGRKYPGSSLSMKFFLFAKKHIQYTVG